MVRKEVSLGGTRMTIHTNGIAIFVDFIYFELFVLKKKKNTNKRTDVFCHKVTKLF